MHAFCIKFASYTRVLHLYRELLSWESATPTRLFVNNITFTYVQLNRRKMDAGEEAVEEVSPFPDFDLFFNSVSLYYHNVTTDRT